MSFTVRPHESVETPEATPTPPPLAHPTAPFVPPTVRTPSGEATALLYETIYRNRKEIPLWLVRAYDTPISPTGGSGQEQNILTRDLHDTLGDGVRDIPILLDDTLYEEDTSLLQQEAFLPSAVPSPRWKDHSRHEMVQRGKRWILPAILLALALSLVLLISKGWLHGFGKKAIEVSRSLKELIPFRQTEEGGLHFSNYNSDFVARGPDKQKIFVIEGKVTNDYSKPCHSIQVKGVLLDERGNQSEAETVFCGNILSKQELRNSSEEEIRKKLQNPVGSSLSNFNIQPGKSIPFTLVFFSPPEKLSEFSIEIAGYKLHDSTSN
jgi:hypothetical protein